MKILFLVPNLIIFFDHFVFVDRKLIYSTYCNIVRNSFIFQNNFVFTHLIIKII